MALLLNSGRKSWPNRVESARFAKKSIREAVVCLWIIATLPAKYAGCSVIDAIHYLGEWMMIETF